MPICRDLRSGRADTGGGGQGFSVYPEMQGNSKQEPNYEMQCRKNGTDYSYNHRIDDNGGRGLFRYLVGSRRHASFIDCDYCLVSGQFSAWHINV